MLGHRLVAQKPEGDEDDVEVTVPVPHVVDDELVAGQIVGVELDGLDDCGSPSAQPIGFPAQIVGVPGNKITTSAPSSTRRAAMA